MNYTIKDLKKDFPNDDKCLDYLFQQRYGHVEGIDKYYRVKGRKCYAHSETGNQLHPLADTIFHKSSTPLTQWFFAMFLFSQSKNGVSAKELQRSLGVTYKCAYRMGQQIRKLMAQEPTMLGGVVETDEAYVGGSASNRAYVKGVKGRANTRPIVLGMVERDGRIITKQIPDVEASTLIGAINDNVDKTARLITDGYNGYKHANWHGFSHDVINHSKNQYVLEDIHTNTIEGYWGQLKRSIKGTYVHVSKQKLHVYLDEFAYRYNRRKSPLHVFQHLLRAV